jgi:hypothetical protein
MAATATLTLSQDPAASRLVRAQARLLLRAHGPLLLAVERRDRAALEQAALDLFVVSTAVFGKLSGALVAKTASPGTARTVRKGRAHAR